jgi:hypothetical protein
MPYEPFSTLLLDPANSPQVNYWAKEFRVDPSELKAAIPFAGRRLTNIRRYLGKTADIVSLDHRRVGRRAKQTRSAFTPVV